MCCLHSVTELIYSEITPTGTSAYCFLSYFECEILINIGSLESLTISEKYRKRPSSSGSDIKENKAC